MRLTVAICTWNRCDLLRQTLERMTRLTVPSGVVFEILVVNNNCTDATDSTVDEFAGRLPIRRVQERTPGVSHARNRALEECRADYILWTDDDVLVDARWLCAFHETVARNPTAVAIGGAIEPWFEIEPDPSLLAAFPILARGFCGRDFGPQERLLESGENIVTANMACRLETCRALRFRTDLGQTPTSDMKGEDVEFLDRLRPLGPVVWAPGMRVKHWVPAKRMTLEYLLSHSRGVGEGFVRAVGMPPGPRLFGVPRWVLREWATFLLGQALLRLTPFRVRALVARREFARRTGILAACRALASTSSVAPDGKTST